MHTNSHSAPAHLLREQEVADFLGVSVYLLQKWRWRGVGPRWIKVGGTTGRAVRYRSADLEAYLEQNTVEPTSLTLSVGR